MRLLTNAHGYKTTQNAERHLRKVLDDSDYDIDIVRWVIVVNAEGRFVPTVMMSSIESYDMTPFVLQNISVLG